MILSGLHLIVVNYSFMDENSQDDKNVTMWIFLMYVPLYLRGFGLI